MQISIKDFLGVESLSLAFKSPINIIVGENEAGKSSIRDAIQWCLTGSARGRKTHNEQAALIRDGAKAAEVTITQPSGMITRKKTPKTAAAVIGPVPKDEVMTSVYCDPLTFLCFPEDKRREILFQLIPGIKPSPDDILKCLKERAEIVTSPKDEGGDKAVEFSLMAGTHGFKTAEDEAITRRRIAKALMKEAKGEEPEQRAIIEDKEYVLPDIQEAEVQEGLAKLQKSRDELLERKGKVMGDMANLQGMEKELAYLEESPVEMPKHGEIERLRAALEASRRSLTDLQKQVDNLGPGKAPKFFPAICPAFAGFEIPCPNAKRIADQGRQAADSAKIEKLQGFVKNDQEEVDRLEKELQEARVKQSAYEEYPQKCRDLASKIARIKDAGTTAKAELDQKIAGLDSRIKIGQELLAAIIKFRQQKDAAKAAAVKLAKAEKEAMLYDALAKALAADGIPSRMIAEALKPVNDLLQVAAVHLFPGRTLTLNKELAIDLSGSPYVTLSKSAKFRVGVAFQYALTKLARARLLMIDEADILDPGNRGKLIDFLLAVRQDFDTILVFATSDHADPSPSPDIQVWWLEKGKITPVSQPMAA